MTSFGPSAHQQKPTVTDTWILVNRRCGRRFHYLLFKKNAISMIPMPNMDSILSPSPLPLLQRDRDLALSVFEQYAGAMDADTLHRIFARFPPDVIFNLGKTSRTLNQIVKIYAARAWDIDAVLGFWFNNPLQFRRVMNICRAVVVGVPALRFFDRGRQATGVCDIITRFHGLLQMGKYIIRAGYMFRPQNGDGDSWELAACSLSGKLRFDIPTRTTRSNGFATGVLRTFRFQRSDGPGHIPQAVHLSVVRYDPVKWLLSAHSSMWKLSICPFKSSLHHKAAAMNFITATHAVSLFPRQTFIDSETYITRQTARHEKDTSRSWVYNHFGTKCKEFGRVTDFSKVPSDVCTSARRVGDHRSWIVKFNRSKLLSLNYQANPEYLFSVHSPNKHTAMLGLCFEILDCRTRVVSPGAFLRIAEPFVLRSVHYLSRVAIVNVDCLVAPEHLQWAILSVIQNCVYGRFSVISSYLVVPSI